MSPPRYTPVSPNSTWGRAISGLQPGEEASVVGVPHIGQTGYEVDADLYRRDEDGRLVRDNRYHTHLDPNTLNRRD